MGRRRAFQAEETEWEVRWLMLLLYGACDVANHDENDIFPHFIGSVHVSSLMVFSKQLVEIYKAGVYYLSFKDEEIKVPRE